MIVVKRLVGMGDMLLMVMGALFPQACIRPPSKMGT
jgi:hypothetical protein